MLFLYYHGKGSKNVLTRGHKVLPDICYKDESIGNNECNVYTGVDTKFRNLLFGLF